jgi:hypothetical protein
MEELEGGKSTSSILFRVLSGIAIFYCTIGVTAVGITYTATMVRLNSIELTTINKEELAAIDHKFQDKCIEITEKLHSIEERIIVLPKEVPGAWATAEIDQLKKVVEDLRNDNRSLQQQINSNHPGP